MQQVIPFEKSARSFDSDELLASWYLHLQGHDHSACTSKNIRRPSPRMRSEGENFNECFEVIKLRRTQKARINNEKEATLS